MANILKMIIEDKRKELEQRKEQQPIELVKDRTAGLRKCRNFYLAVTKPSRRGVNVIAEVKKASPSAGVIRGDFDPVAIAQTYERCGADAISVLTDEKYFQGKLEYLTAVKEAVSVPVLRKDFIIDPYQVYEARAAGADAILLIAEALNAAEMMDLLILATELTLTSLIEVHDADTLLQVRSLLGFPQKHYSVLGINNRDLATMKVDVNTTGRLADLVENRRELISESGIRTRADVEKLIRLGVGGVLIGQTLCESESIESKFNELFEPGRR
ncbi:MAG: indole-3-glycerol phosphate synthase TrpC [Planctomycetaceae bacterium]|nr:indole-3-glycerol phosphate synthase TrpC [Planctomycetaceae bacterium]